LVVKFTQHNNENEVDNAGIYFDTKAKIWGTTILNYRSVPNSQSNSFEIRVDGRTKVYGTPKEVNDVIRWQEYQKLITAIEELGGSVV
jgi:hypothetical protein